VTEQRGRAAHWDGRYTDVGAEQVSWFDPHLQQSLELIELAGASPTTSVVDAGGGASVLVDRLLDLGVADLTVVDVSAAALEESRRRVAGRPGAASVAWVVADLLGWEPGRTWDLWHDRAAFHFLTEPEQIASYVTLVERSVRPGGHLVVATFADDGPTSCSGLRVARYSTAALTDVFARGFEPVTRAHEDHLTPAGTTQSFSWVLLRRRNA
jgi:trans-aconitate methyltransferase